MYLSVRMGQNVHDFSVDKSYYFIKVWENIKNLMVLARSFVVITSRIWAVVFRQDYCVFWIFFLEHLK